MTPLRTILLISALLGIAATTQMEDAELKRLIVGTWQTHPDEKFPSVGTTTYDSSGIAVSTYRLRNKPESASFRVTTRWSIHNRILTFKCIASTDPRLPIGSELKDRIISITQDRLVYELYDGYKGKMEKPSVMIRIKD